MSETVITTELANSLIVNDDKELLLVYSVEANTWGIPGGEVKLGESASEAAIREAAEELSIGVHIIRHLGRISFSDVSGNFVSDIFETVLDKGSIKVNEPRNFYEFRFMSIDKMKKIAESSEANKTAPGLSTLATKVLEQVAEDKLPMTIH